MIVLLYVVSLVIGLVAVWMLDPVTEEERNEKN